MSGKRSGKFRCTVGHISEATIRRYIEMQKDK